MVIQALVCLALVLILAWQAVLIMIESLIRVVGMSIALAVVIVPAFVLMCYLIG